MIVDKNIARLVAELEYHIGWECYNPNSYDGWNDIEGCDFRYPIMVPYENDNGEIRFAKIKSSINNSYTFSERDIDPYSVQYMKYRFGSNELFIGRGLIEVLKVLESRYGLDFNELENSISNS